MPALEGKYFLIAIDVNGDSVFSRLGGAIADSLVIEDGRATVEMKGFVIGSTAAKCALSKAAASGHDITVRLTEPTDDIWVGRFRIARYELIGEATGPFAYAVRLESVEPIQFQSA